ncbi:MAG: glutaredoxin [Alcaligenaceae bacterium]|nr:glutaredoxin [Alcaligenaceae bacterium]
MLVNALRNGLGCIVATVDQLTRPAKMERSPDAQAEVNTRTAKMTLYQFHGCPFCIKVRRTMHKLNLPIQTRDVNKDAAAEQELISGGGKRTVPCLRIEHEDGTVQWMYESSDIINYLESNFAHI